MRVAANMPVYKRRQFRSTFGFDLMLPPTSHSLGLDRLLGRPERLNMPLLLKVSCG